MLVRVMLEPKELKVIVSAIDLYRQVIKASGMQESEHLKRGYSRLFNTLSNIPEEDLKRR